MMYDITIRHCLKDMGRYAIIVRGERINDLTYDKGATDALSLSESWIVFRRVRDDAVPITVRSASIDAYWEE